MSNSDSINTKLLKSTRKINSLQDKVKQYENAIHKLNDKAIKEIRDMESGSLLLEIDGKRNYNHIKKQLEAANKRFKSNEKKLAKTKKAHKKLESQRRKESERAKRMASKRMASKRMASKRMALKKDNTSSNEGTELMPAVWNGGKTRTRSNKKRRLTRSKRRLRRSKRRSNRR